MNTCSNPCCSNLTNNPKYCSKSCSAIINGAKFPKRIARKNYCQKCGLEALYKRKFCKQCFMLKSKRHYSTLEEVTYATGHKSNASSYVRTMAREENRDLQRSPCFNCGYSKHVEICHIKSIRSHSPDTLISEINHRSNLLALCRNCHWEFDHGELSMEALVGVAPTTVRLEGDSSIYLRYRA